MPDYFFFLGIAPAMNLPRRSVLAAAFQALDALL
jgi:hypothetical protein